MPDTGMISYAELADQGQNICRAVSIPMIGDGDTGFGSAQNIKRTVEGYARAGFAGIMLEDQVAARNDSWAIRWHASCFLDDMLTLYPGRSLVENIGNDASGTHCSATSAYSQDVLDAQVEVARIPLVESVEARRAFMRFFRNRRSIPIASRAARVLKRLYQKVA